MSQRTQCETSWRCSILEIAQYRQGWGLVRHALAVNHPYSGRAGTRNPEPSSVDAVLPNKYSRKSSRYLNTMKFVCRRSVLYLVPLIFNKNLYNIKQPLLCNFIKDLTALLIVIIRASSQLPSYGVEVRS